MRELTRAQYERLIGRPYSEPRTYRPRKHRHLAGWTEERFQAALSQTGIRSPSVIEVARRVLVDGIPLWEASGQKSADYHYRYAIDQLLKTAISC